ncbi:S66 peptidase family protein [Alicyclobacillus sp. SO9]|uniref:S66 family peptidase n=1 Tax=Alicyclobacillus sp. SO9 TaxID=2665646 RepID=UPI0018E7E363|nr:S66 peptidase family protein [Alicyclobacillus sp. SO9]QQE79092.1 LD-carboxypeptidase [Alicyclobacillus sp. SO9]
MRYPVLKPGAVVGVTAPSSGVQTALHNILKLACRRMEEKGYGIQCGETIWTQHKAKSAAAKVRADEFNAMMKDDEVDIIIPPWGGELLIEILEYIEFDSIPAKWILGYSDVSALLFTVTVKTGIATAHGTNLMDLRGEYSDETTAAWEAVLAAGGGGTVIQYSSEKYQTEWDHDNPSPCIYHLTEPTMWKTVSGITEHLKGRLLGGCIDVIRHLVGTPFGDVAAFREKFTRNEPILWYFENAEMNTVELRRSLVQMRLAGWFDHAAGIMFGRSSANQAVDGYTVEDVYRELSAELQLPIVYDVDCGHVPPQVTLINGARAEVEVEVEVNGEGRGKLVQHFV